MKKVPRGLQPARRGPTATVAQARRAWREVEAKRARSTTNTRQAPDVHLPSHPETTLELQVRKLQPAFRSKNITLEQARAAWIKVEAEEAAREARRLRRAGRRAPRSHAAEAEKR